MVKERTPESTDPQREQAPEGVEVDPMEEVAEERVGVLKRAMNRLGGGVEAIESSVIDHLQHQSPEARKRWETAKGLPFVDALIAETEAGAGVDMTTGRRLDRREKILRHFGSFGKLQVAGGRVALNLLSGGVGKGLAAILSGVAEKSTSEGGKVIFDAAANFVREHEEDIETIFGETRTTSRPRRKRKKEGGNKKKGRK